MNLTLLIFFLHQDQHASNIKNYKSLINHHRYVIYDRKRFRGGMWHAIHRCPKADKYMKNYDKNKN